MKHVNMILNALFKGSVSLGLVVIALALIVSPLLTNAELKTIAVNAIYAIISGLVFLLIKMILEKIEFNTGSVQ